MAAMVIEGPTDLRALPILSGTVAAFYFLKLWVMINMLSTPIAKMRKGITSILIMVIPILKYDTIPIDENIEAPTIKIPPIPRVNPL